MLDAGRNTALKRESNKAENDKVFGKLPLVLKSEASERTVVKVRNVLIGGERVVVIAGPCSVESRQQVIETALAVRERGAVMLRGGAYKPRTSPYDFQGLGVEGLKGLPGFPL